MGKAISAGGSSSEIRYSDEAQAADDKTFWLMTRDELNHYADPEVFQSVLAELRGTTEQQVTKPHLAVKELANTFELSGDEEESVLSNFIKDRDYSQWGLVNAVTASAKEAESYERSTELEALGGRVAELRGEAWESVAG